MSLSRKFSTSLGTITIEYAEPSICPLCKHAIKPEELSFYSYKNDKDETFVCCTYLCKSCYQTFLSLYRVEQERGNRGNKTTLLLHGPAKYAPETFDATLSSLSPQFVKIYNQALAAETSGLDEIAGLGYRKAMEFLIKDFCIRKNPTEAEQIKAMPLSPCISKYVQNPEIQTLATRTAWIGNDEAHYIRKQEDRDVSDMKQFIKAMVYFVGMSLIVDDAASMSPV